MLFFVPLFETLEDRKLLASTASIAGFVFNDANSNGKRDTGESGIVQITVYLDKNNNKRLDATEKSTTTSSTGSFSFTKLAAGSYIVRQIRPAALTQTTPKNNFGVHVTLSAGQSVMNRLIGDFVNAITPAKP